MMYIPVHEIARLLCTKITRVSVSVLDSSCVRDCLLYQRICTAGHCTPQHWLRVGGWYLVWRTGCSRTVVSTSATTRLGALAYHSEVAINSKQ
jgi:hypothetical protein